MIFYGLSVNSSCSSVPSYSLSREFVEPIIALTLSCEVGEIKSPRLIGMEVENPQGEVVGVIYFIR